MIVSVSKEGAGGAEKMHKIASNTFFKNMTWLHSDYFQEAFRILQKW